MNAAWPADQRSPARECSRTEPAWDWCRLQPYESVAHLGRGPSALYATDVPRYVEMGRYIFDRLGWDAERFLVYRCRLEYPVLPSTVVMQFDLPPAPGA
jgi:hypothetical protein